MARSLTEHRVHKETARDAGFGSLSLISVLAGVVCAYGTFAVVAAVATTARADIRAERIRALQGRGMKFARF